MPRKYGYHWPEDFHEDPNFVMNARQLDFFNKFKTACESAGGRMISTQYHNSRVPLWFYCTHCGQPHYNTWHEFNAGKNLKFLCFLCMYNASPSITSIQEVFANRGAYLLTDQYINQYQKLKFLCSKCGRVHSITWNSFQSGTNPDLLCSFCNYKVLPSIDFIHLIFAERGAALITDHYVNAFQRLYFLCSICGQRHYISWLNFRHGRNKYLLCPKCMQIQRFNAFAISMGRRNTDLGGLHWFNLGRLFFNVKVSGTGLAHHGECQPYSFHHLLKYSEYPLLRSSLTNGYPIKTELHKDNSCEFFRIIHSEKWNSPNSWNSDEFINKYSNYYNELKLPFHNYPNFRFRDLTEFLVTETVLDNTDLDMIHQHEKYWKNKGRIYIPVSWKEYAYKPDRDRFFSQIRDELRQFIPEIDQYTGVGYKL